jgi:hypothetical protein
MATQATTVLLATLHPVMPPPQAAVYQVATEFLAFNFKAMYEE